jgi:hypothetical protein
MIRVSGSRANPPIFMVPSHLYKYSETELDLYLKERKNLWSPLGRILNQNVDVHDAELMIHFPISMFNDVAGIVPFVRKRGSGIQSEAFKEARRLTQFRAKNGDKTGQNETKTGGRVINTLAPMDQPERRYRSTHPVLRGSTSPVSERTGCDTLNPAEGMPLSLVFQDGSWPAV